MAKNKRSLRQKLAYKRMLKQLDGMLGEENAGLFLAMNIDCLEKLVAGTDGRELRTIKIEFNDYFSVKFDCATGRYIE